MPGAAHIDIKFAGHITPVLHPAQSRIIGNFKTAVVSLVQCNDRRTMFPDSGYMNIYAFVTTSPEEWMLPLTIRLGSTMILPLPFAAVFTGCISDAPFSAITRCCLACRLAEASSRPGVASKQNILVGKFIVLIISDSSKNDRDDAKLAGTISKALNRYGW
jgi:hypothetical protein